MDSLTRFAEAFGKNVFSVGIENTEKAWDLGTFINTISNQIFSQSGAAEQMLLMGLACSAEALTKAELMKAINWDADYLERVLTERSRVITMLDQEQYKENKLAIYHPSIRQGILNAALRGQTRLIHKRLIKNYLHRDLSDYWLHPRDIGLALYHLRASESPEIVNFLLLAEIKTLSRLWGLTDIMIDAVKFAIEQVKSYKPASVSVEIVDSDERLNFQIGEEDVKAAESSLYREYAYFLEISGQISTARDAWERSLTAIDRSNVDAKTYAKLKALVWADIAQLRFENGKNSEAVEALQKEIQYLRQSGVTNNILAAALHNLGLVQLRLDDFSEARQSFKQAFSASKKTSLQATEDTIQIAHTWRLEGNLDKAISYYQAAADVTEALGGKGSYLQAVALGYLALGQLEQGNLNSAYENAKKARSLFSSQGASNDIEMTDQLLQEIQRAREASR